MPIDKELARGLLQQARTLVAHHDENGSLVYACFFRSSQSIGAVLLLEVTKNTVPAGVVPVWFGTSSEFQFPTCIVEVTPSEFKAIQCGDLAFPPDWCWVEDLLSRPAELAKLAELKPSVPAPLRPAQEEAHRIINMLPAEADEEMLAELRWLAKNYTRK